MTRTMRMRRMMTNKMTTFTHQTSPSYSPTPTEDQLGLNLDLLVIAMDTIIQSAPNKGDQAMGLPLFVDQLHSEDQSKLNMVKDKEELDMDAHNTMDHHQVMDHQGEDALHNTDMTSMKLKRPFQRVGNCLMERGVWLDTQFVVCIMEDIQ